MIQLTEQQHVAMDQQGHDLVRAIDPATKEEYVLLPVRMYDRLKLILSKDDAWTGAGYEAAMEVFARDGWDDPRMEIYESDQRVQAP